MPRQTDTKETILKTALDLFSKHGYAGSSIRMIANKTGIRESAVYNHFSSKEAIFNAVRDRYSRLSYGKDLLTDDLIEELSDPNKFLHSFARKLVSIWSDENEIKFIRMLLMEQFTGVGETGLSLTDSLSELRSICKMLFGEMIKHNFVRKTDVDLLADEYILPLYFIRIEHISSPAKPDYDLILNLVNTHVDFFWNAVEVK